MQKVLVSIVTCLFLVSCVKKRDLKQNVVVFSLESYPSSLHLFNENSGPSSEVFAYTQSNLIGVDTETDQYKPVLLKELPKPDSTGLVYHMELADFAKWDDGEPFSVADVIFSWKITLCPLTDNAGSRNIYASIISDVYADSQNPQAFYVRVKNVHYNNIAMVTSTQLAQKSKWDPKGLLNELTFKNMLSDNFKSTAEIDEWFNAFNSADNGQLPERLVGLGPYQVKELATKAYIILEKKKDWWGDTLEGEDFDAYPDKLIFKVTEDPSSGYLAVKNEELDVVKNRGSSWVSKFIRLRRLDHFNETYYSEFVRTNLYRYFGMNLKPDGINHKPYFTDVKVRRAMALLCPLDDMAEYLYYGEAERVASILPPFHKSADTTLKLIPYDVELAKKLLKEAGWVDTDGDGVIDKMINGEKVQFSFKMNYVSVPYLREIAIVMKESMRQAGVEMTPNPLDFGTMFGSAYDHDFDAILAAWGGTVGYSDPIQIWGSKSWASKGANFVGFGDAESDSLIVASNTSLDPKEHLKAYHALQRKIYNEQPYVFFWSEKYVMASHKRFKKTKFYKAGSNVNLGSLQLIEQ